MKYFWTHHERIPEGKGYGQFSKKHIILIISMIIIAIGYTIFYINSDIAIQGILKKSISIILIISEIIKLIIISKSGLKISNYLPLEICSIACYLIIFDAFFPQNRIFIQSLLTLFLPAASIALLYPTTIVLPIFNFYTIHQFLFHELIIIYVVGCYINKEISIDFLGFIKSILILIVIVIIVYIIDTIFNKNYMFLKNSYGNAMLGKLDKLSGGGYKYSLALIIFALVVVNIFFVLFKILELLL